MSLSIQVKGLTELIKKVDLATETKLHRLLNAALGQSSMVVWSALNSNTPVDTGNLTSSNRREVLALEARIGPDIGTAYYAPFVEKGHHTRSGSWVPGQHYIQRTQLETYLQVKNIFVTNLQQLF